MKDMQEKGEDGIEDAKNKFADLIKGVEQNIRGM
jgi:hypothetical protein